MKTLGILALILISFNSYAVCNQQKQFSLVIHAGSGSGHEPKAKQEEIPKEFLPTSLPPKACLAAW